MSPHIPGGSTIGHKIAEFEIANNLNMGQALLMAIGLVLILFGGLLRKRIVWIVGLILIVIALILFTIVSVSGLLS